MKKSKSFREMVNRLHKYSRKLGRQDAVTAAMISVATWNSIQALGESDGLHWISAQVNDAAKSAVNIRKKHGLPI